MTKMLLDIARGLPRRYPNTTCRTEPSVGYNCHGMTFASRRTWIYRAASIRDILADDVYEEVQLTDVLPGDIVVYYSETADPNHSAIVVEWTQDLVQPIVCSKWAHAGEFIHGLRDCPELYGPITRFFRCLR